MPPMRETARSTPTVARGSPPSVGLLSDTAPGDLDDALMWPSGTWLQLTINGVAMAPRMAVLSVPYARMAADAERFGGLEPLDYLQQGDVDALSLIDPEYTRRLLIALMIGIAISGTLSFFTVPLIWFRRQPLLTALGTGFRALIANWKPFIVLGLGLAAISLPFGFAAGILFSC